MKKGNPTCSYAFSQICMALPFVLPVLQAMQALLKSWQSFSFLGPDVPAHGLASSRDNLLPLILNLPAHLIFTVPKIL